MVIVGSVEKLQIRIGLEEENIMKKAIALCLTAAMAASLLTGCGSKTTETTARQRTRQRRQQVRAAEEKKMRQAGVVKVIEYDLTDEQYAFGVDKDQPGAA